MSTKMLASTGDVRKEYEVVGIVSAYFSTLVKKEPSSSDDVFSHLIQELKDKASKMGGNGVIFIRVDRENISAGYAVGANYLAYGTVINLL